MLDRAALPSFRPESSEPAFRPDGSRDLDIERARRERRRRAAESLRRDEEELRRQIAEREKRKS